LQLSNANRQERESEQIILIQYKKSETNPLLIQQHFAEFRSVAAAYSAIYTDGSEDGD
jgi:hypothetical protein